MHVIVMLNHVEDSGWTATVFVDGATAWADTGYHRTVAEAFDTCLREAGGKVPGLPEDVSALARRWTFERKVPDLVQENADLRNRIEVLEDIVGRAGCANQK